LSNKIDIEESIPLCTVRFFLAFKLADAWIACRSCLGRPTGYKVGFSCESCQVTTGNVAACMCIDCWLFG